MFVGLAMKNFREHDMAFSTPLLVLLLGFLTLGMPTSAAGGCGCKKPPPPLASIRPAFAAPGSEVTLFADGLVEGVTYDAVFTSAGMQATVSAVAIVRADFADGVYKPQLVVEAPELTPGPASVTLRDGDNVLLEISDSEFTLLQSPIVLEEGNVETVAECYRAAVGADNTVYFPLDVSAIGQRTVFSGAAKGYRFTFDADDITIYNRQGVLMQTLGPDETDIFLIEDDQKSDDSLVAPVALLGDARYQVGADVRRAMDLDNVNKVVTVDFDPHPSRELGVGFYPVPSFDELRGRMGVGTGVPASGGVMYTGGENTFGALVRAWGSFKKRGSTVSLAVDARFVDPTSDAAAALGIFTLGGGRAFLVVRPDGEGGLEASISSGIVGESSSSVEIVRTTEFTSNWLRLSVVFTYTGEGMTASTRVFDIGADGTGEAFPLLKLAGSFSNRAIEGNRIVVRAFGGMAPETVSDTDGLVYFDNFADEAWHTPEDDEFEDFGDESADEDDGGTGATGDDSEDDHGDDSGDSGDGYDDDGGNVGDVGGDGQGSGDDGSLGDDATEQSDDEPADDDPGAGDADDGESDENSGDPGHDDADGDAGDSSNGDSDDDSPVDGSVSSFKLTYDRHQFLSYQSMHSMNPNYLLSDVDPEWHIDGTRHVDHEHLIVAVHGLVNGEIPPPPGRTPAFDLRIRTVLADAPLAGDGPTTRTIEFECGNETATGSSMMLCGPTPQSDCRVPARPRAATIALKDGKSDARDELVWKWLKGQATELADFGDPTATDDAALCIYDESGATAELTLKATVPAGGECTSGSRVQPCWERGDRGFRYQDSERAASGIAEVTLRSGKKRKAKILVNGRGENLDLPSLPLSLPMRVQLQSASGQCWEATYSTAKKNTKRQFKAKAD